MAIQKDKSTNSLRFGRVELLPVSNPTTRVDYDCRPIGYDMLVAGDSKNVNSLPSHPHFFVTAFSLLIYGLSKSYTTTGFEAIKIMLPFSSAIFMALRMWIFCSNRNYKKKTNRLFELMTKYGCV